jgi:hypothetical protein
MPLPVPEADFSYGALAIKINISLSRTGLWDAGNRNNWIQYTISVKFVHHSHS